MWRGQTTTKKRLHWSKHPARILSNQRVQSQMSFCLCACFQGVCVRRNCILVLFQKLKQQALDKDCFRKQKRGKWGNVWSQIRIVYGLKKKKEMKALEKNTRFGLGQTELSQASNQSSISAAAVLHCEGGGRKQRKIREIGKGSFCAPVKKRNCLKLCILSLQDGTC